jgi:hypothetical protein
MYVSYAGRRTRPSEYSTGLTSGAALEFHHATLFARLEKQLFRHDDIAHAGKFGLWSANS